MFKQALLFFGAVLLLLVTAVPARAGHCGDMTSILNAVLAHTSGTTVVATYESLDATVYLGFANNFPGGDKFLTGDVVIVVSNERYPNVVLMVFHDDCYVGEKGILRSVHGNWNEMITGVEASHDGPT